MSSISVNCRSASIALLTFTPKQTYFNPILNNFQQKQKMGLDNLIFQNIHSIPIPKI